MTAAAGHNGLVATPATHPQSPRVTPEIIALHTRRSQRMRQRAMHAALRACGRGLVELARRAARTLVRRLAPRPLPLRRITALWR